MFSATPFKFATIRGQDKEETSLRNAQKSLYGATEDPKKAREWSETFI